MNEQINNIKGIWTNKAKIIGDTAAAALLSQLYPIDFECYMIAFELCDSKGENTLDFFTFPIMPTELSIEEELPVKIQNTFGGVNSISSSIFVPKNIRLNGNFGRQFRVLVRNKMVIPFINKTIQEQERDYGIKGVQRKETIISDSIKTGFGAFKVLQSIINRAVEVDKTGECNRLYMYNMAYGESYLVKPLNFRGSQSLNHNGIWNYELDLKAICPIHIDSHERGKSIRVYSKSTIQFSLNSVLKGMKQTYNVNN